MYIWLQEIEFMEPMYHVPLMKPLSVMWTVSPSPPYHKSIDASH